MRRREFLSGTLVVLASGCVSVGQSGSDNGGVSGSGEAGVEIGTKTATQTETPTGTPTATRTPTPTPTSTPELERPDVTRVQSVSDWHEMGDISRNAVETVEVGQEFWVAYHYTFSVRNQTTDLTDQARIFDSSGDRVGINTNSGETLVESSGSYESEGALQFFSHEWDPGKYTAEVIVKDNISGKVSKPETGTFDVVS